MPYRRRTTEATVAPTTDDGDGVLLPVVVLLWIASVALCGCTLARGAPLEGEAALAVLCVLGLPRVAFPRIKKL